MPDPDVRGGFLNLALHSTRADMYRATLEALGYTLCECIALLRECGLPTAALRAIGGGAKSDIWLQLSADILGMPIERPEITEAATLGAAMIAAVGAGDFLSLEDCSAAFYKGQKVFVPDPEHHALYAEYHPLYVEQLREIAESIGLSTMGARNHTKNGEAIRKKGH